jgi:hypothetical protein
LRRFRSGGLLLAGFGAATAIALTASIITPNREASLRAARFPGLAVSTSLPAALILITHSAFGIPTDEQAHRALKAINWILVARLLTIFTATRILPNNLEASVTRSGPTTVMNVFPYKVIEY